MDSIKPPHLDGKWTVAKCCRPISQAAGCNFTRQAHFLTAARRSRCSFAAQSTDAAGAVARRRPAKRKARPPSSELGADTSSPRSKHGSGAIQPRSCCTRIALPSWDILEISVSSQNCRTWLPAAARQQYWTWRLTATLDASSAARGRFAPRPIPQNQLGCRLCCSPD